MPAGEVLDPAHADLVRHVIADAEARTGLSYRVHVGPSEGDPRTYAERLLAAMPDAAATVLVHVDPTVRRIEVLTGRLAAWRLDDRDCALAALSMGSSFAGGDLAGGLAAGVRMLAEHAGPVDLSR